MLEIVISESEKNVLNYSHLFTKNDIVSFSLLLTYGKIKDVEQNEYKKVFDIELNPKNIFNELIEKIDNYGEIRIWYSSCDSESLNTYYFLVNYLSNKNKTIYCCDVYNKEYSSLGSYDSTKIEKTKLAKIEAKLYGTDEPSGEPTLLMPDEIISMLKAAA